MSIRDAIRLRPVQKTLRDGTPYVLRRPSALDLIEAIEMQKTAPDRMQAWMAHRHVLDVDLTPVWNSLDEALAAPAALVTELAMEADKLYAEGRD